MTRSLRFGIVLPAVLVCLAGCASNEDALADKDRIISEKSEEADALRRELADAHSTRLVLEKQLGQKNSEMARVAAENARLAGEASSLRDEMRTASVVEKAEPEVLVADENVTVDRRPNGDVVLRISDRVTFTPGNAALTRQGQTILDAVAAAIRKHPDYGVSVEGHTDDTPLNRTADRWQTNMNLSIARAQSVRDYLAKKGGVPELRMRVVGYGENAPLVKGTTKDARAQNRRVEVVLLHVDG